MIYEPYKPKISGARVNLNVPYKDKDQAKAVGAKWSANQRTWYVEPGKDLNKFKRWLA